MTVLLCAANGDKGIALFQKAAVGAYTRDLKCGLGGAVFDVTVVYKIIKDHWKNHAPLLM